MSDRGVRRPGGITFLAVIIVIGGLFALFAGTLLVILRNDVTVQTQNNMSSNVMLWTGIVTIIFGLVYVLVARGLTRGSGLARGLAALVTILSLAGSVYQAIVYSGNLRTNAIVNAVIAVIILALLFSSRANEFFRSRA